VTRNLLLTGMPGVGKTTLVERVVMILRERGVPASGFFTAEVRDGARKRQGFRYRTLEGREGWLARRGHESPARVSSYGVLLESFERDVLPVIDPDRCTAPCIVIDEIGKMEAFSTGFREAVERALDSDRVVLATVSRTAGGWLGSIRSRHDVLLREADKMNRDALPDDLARGIEEALQS
jgi:nucleoside-triphosphatase